MLHLRQHRKEAHGWNVHVCHGVLCLWVCVCNYVYIYIYIYNGVNGQLFHNVILSTFVGINQLFLNMATVSEDTWLIHDFMLVCHVQRPGPLTSMSKFLAKDPDLMVNLQLVGHVCIYDKCVYKQEPGACSADIDVNHVSSSSLLREFCPRLMHFRPSYTIFWGKRNQLC